MVPLGRDARAVCGLVTRTRCRALPVDEPLDDASVGRYQSALVSERKLELTINDGQPTIRGEIDLLSLPELESWLDRVVDEYDTIDLNDVTFFDSSALRTFLTIRRRKPAFRIVHPSKAVARVLEITGTADYLVHGREINW
jgi:anti-anti-sigma factor